MKIDQKKVRPEWFLFFKNTFTHLSCTLSRLLRCPGTFGCFHKSPLRLMSGLLQHRLLLFFKPLCLVWKSTRHCLLGRPYLFWVHHTGLAATMARFLPKYNNGHLCRSKSCGLTFYGGLFSEGVRKLTSVSGFFPLVNPHVLYMSLPSSFANVNVRWLHGPRWT